MSNVILFDNQSGPLAAPSQKFGALQAAGLGMDLGEGIRSSFGIVGIKGGKFRIRYRGEDRLLDIPHPQDPSQRLPVSFIDVVIVKANAFLNKQFYKGIYQEGSDSPPDCYSLNGKTPSSHVAQPVHTSCALCPMNVFGSKISESGQKTKACRDTKKLAIVPLADLRNATMGGAMLFRVPPSALKDLSVMADALKGRGYPYNSVAVRIGFDTTVSHPKPTFQALRPLTDLEAEVVVEMFSSDQVETVLGDDETVVDTPAVSHAVPSAEFLQAPAGAVRAPATHNWEPGQPLPSRDLTQIPEVDPAATAPRPQMPRAMLNTPAGAPTVVVGAQPFQAPVHTLPPTVQLAPEPVATAQPAQPAANPFAVEPGSNNVAKPARAASRKPITPVAAPVAASVEMPTVDQSQLDAEIGGILEGLGDFMGKA